MILTENSSLNRLLEKLKEKISLGERVKYFVPDLWNCFDYQGQEKFVDEKGITSVNPYNFYFSCIKDYILVKRDITKNYNKSISQTTSDLSDENGHLGGDWITKSSMYAMDVRISTCWNQNENGFKEAGTFIKTIALLPLLKKMGIDTLYLLPIFKFEKFSPIDPDLKDTILGDDFTAEEEFRALVEACHILDIRVILDITSFSIASKEDLITYYQNNFGIDGARLDMGQAFETEVTDSIIDNSRKLDSDFSFITEGSFNGDVKLARENGFNMISGFCKDLEARISECRTYDFKYAVSKLKEPVFACAETPYSPRIAKGENGRIASRFLTILNEFLPNSVPVIISGLEVYDAIPLNLSSKLAWTSEGRWDIPDTLEAMHKIKNQFLDTFSNPDNFFNINFESPYTTAVGFAYIIEGKRWQHNDNVIIIVGNSDLCNSREYTLFLDNIRYESGNGSKKAWLMYSQNEWSHDIYDFDHQSDLQLSFKPGEVKILIM